MSGKVQLNSLLFKIAGMGAFFSLGFFLAGLFISSFNEDFGEFLIVSSPTLPLLPMVLAFHQLHHSRFPYWSHAVRAIGIIGGASVLIACILGLLNPAHFSASAGAFVLSMIGCIGVWLLLNGLLSLQARVIPRFLAMLGIAVGIAAWGMLVFLFARYGQFSIESPTVVWIIVIANFVFP
ncbi:MAG: hypothetical protein AAGF26_19550, partial [Cyanobacteria bacterium P01_G01_bin.49]